MIDRLAPRRPLVVIPAYMEQAAVGAVIREVRAALPEIQILVIDDASVDQTRARALAAGAEVLTLPFNLGVGGAMRLGFRYAIRHGYDAVVQVDGDGQHNPADVATLLAGLTRADVVIGARFAGVGDYTVRGPRRWAMRLMSAVLSRRAGTRLDDTTSGFRASGPHALGLFATNYPAEYLGDTVVSLVIALGAGLEVMQIPVTMRVRQGGVPSSSPLKAVTYLFRAVLAMFLASTRKWDPPALLPAHDDTQLEEMT